MPYFLDRMIFRYNILLIAKVDERPSLLSSVFESQLHAHFLLSLVPGTSTNRVTDPGPDPAFVSPIFFIIPVIISTPLSVYLSIYLNRTLFSLSRARSSNDRALPIIFFLFFFVS